jgi:hypothetical protein
MPFGMSPTLTGPQCRAHARLLGQSRIPNQALLEGCPVRFTRRFLVFVCAVLAIVAVLIVFWPSRERNKSNPVFPATGDILVGNNPRAILKAAIEAYGGKEKLGWTLTGVLQARLRASVDVEFDVLASCDETFELPRRYKRVIKAQRNGEKRSMEYAVTEGNGWIRQDGGEVHEFHGQYLPLNRSWNAMLAILPSLLEDDFQLKPGGEEKADGRELVGVKVSGEGTEYTLFFDRKSGLLAKSKRLMEHPLLGGEVNGEVLFGDYKEVSGIQYPMRITACGNGKKLFEVEVMRIEFRKKIDDRVFDKP